MATKNISKIISLFSQLNFSEKFWRPTKKLPLDVESTGAEIRKSWMIDDNLALIIISN